jgi:hypothetical protein
MKTSGGGNIVYYFLRFSAVNQKKNITLHAVNFKMQDFNWCINFINWNVGHTKFLFPAL